MDKLIKAVPVIPSKVRSNLTKIIKRTGSLVQEDVPPEAAAIGTNAPGTILTLSTASGATLSKNRLRPLWAIKGEQVALPSAIAEPFKRWKKNPQTFLQSESLRVPSSCKEHYEYSLSVHATAATHKIICRFIACVYYDIISELSASDRYTTTGDGITFVAAVICESTTYDRKEVESNISKWASDGKKYRTLADKVGGTWCYFFFPDIGELM